VFAVLRLLMSFEVLERFTTVLALVTWKLFFLVKILDMRREVRFSRESFVATWHDAWNTFLSSVIKL
jgi:hypothetical protein